MHYQNKEIYIVFAKPVSQWPALIQHLHVVAVRWHQKPFSHQREKYIFCSIGQQQKVEGRSRLFIILETFDFLLRSPGASSKQALPAKWKANSLPPKYHSWDDKSTAEHLSWPPHSFFRHFFLVEASCPVLNRIVRYDKCVYYQIVKLKQLYKGYLR